MTKMSFKHDRKWYHPYQNTPKHTLNLLGYSVPLCTILCWSSHVQTGKWPKGFWIVWVLYYICTTLPQRRRRKKDQLWLWCLFFPILYLHISNCLYREKNIKRISPLRRESMDLKECMLKIGQKFWLWCHGRKSSPYTSNLPLLFLRTISPWTWSQIDSCPCE